MQTDMEILKNLHDNTLNRYLDETADLYMVHAKKRKLILPNETDFAYKHCSDNVIDSIWGSTKPESEFSKKDGEYNHNIKRIMLTSEFRSAVMFPNEKKLITLNKARMTAFHEIGHTFQYDDFSTINDMNTFDYDEAINDFAEMMVALSYYRNGGQYGVDDARIEFCCDDSISSSAKPEDLQRWVEENIQYVLYGKNGSKTYPAGYSAYYANTFKLMKSFDLSVKDAIRAGTVFNKGGMDELSKQYNKKYKGRSFQGLIELVGSKRFENKSRHLPPLTLNDCKKYIKEING